MKKYLKKIIIILIILAGAFYAYKYVKGRNSTVNQVVTQKVELSSLTLKYDLQGIVESKKVISVFSNSTAVVDKVNYRDGEEVKKGDILLELKKDIYDVKKLSIEESKLHLETAKKEYEDAKKLYSVGGISKDALYSAKTQYSDSLIKLKMSMSDYKEFDRVIKSPISGVILESKADVNYTIDARVPLFKIADTENLQIMLEVANSMAKNIKENDIVSITSDAIEKGKVLNGKVKSISKTTFKSNLNNENITRVIVELEDFANLKPGDSVEASVIYKNIENKVIIPFQYIVNENNKTVVYINKNGIVDKKEIVLGEGDGINYEVISGLNKDDVMLYNPNNQYKIGDKIK